MKKVIVFLAAGLLSSMSAVAQITLRPEVAQPLQAAQADLAEKRFAQALQHAVNAQKTKDLTAAEKSVIEQIVAAAAIEAKDYPKAIEATTYLSRDENLTGENRLQYTESLISLLRVTKDMPRLVGATRKYLEDGGSKESIRELHVQAMSVIGNHQEVIQYLESRLRSTPAAKVSEQELRALAVAYKSIKDDAGYYGALKLLVKHFPSKDYWFDVLTRLQKQAYFNPRFELDVYRLMKHLNLLDEADDYFYYAQLALKAGLPAEAKRVLEAGKLAKAFSDETHQVSLKKLEQLVASRLAEDDRQVKQLKEVAQSQNAADLAEVSLSRGDYQEASGKYAVALGGQTLRREAEYRLHQVIALIMQGQKE